MEWEVDLVVCIVLLSGVGECGLCVGGDIVVIYYVVCFGIDDVFCFWVDEYVLDVVIVCYLKFYVVFMDGLVLGGGVGLLVYGGICVVMECMWVGMLEVFIGFFLDVVGIWLFV